MSRDDVCQFVDYLEKMIGDRFVPLTWNGLSFDYDILAEESGLQHLWNLDETSMKAGFAPA